MNGTSLQDLQNRESNDQLAFYNQMQQLQQRQGHNTQHQVHQGQHETYVVPQVHVEDLAQDINNQLVEDQAPMQPVSKSPPEESMKDKLRSKLRNPVIFMVIYFVMSLPYVKNLIGNYITWINPDFNGNISFTGIAFYGVVLFVLYETAKKFLPK